MTGLPQMHPFWASYKSSLYSKEVVECSFSLARFCLIVDIFSLCLVFCTSLCQRCFVLFMGFVTAYFPPPFSLASEDSWRIHRKILRCSSQRLVNIWSYELFHLKHVTVISDLETAPGRCDGFGWDRFNFLHCTWCETELWMVLGAELMTEECFSCGWAACV